MPCHWVSVISFLNVSTKGLGLLLVFSSRIKPLNFCTLSLYFLLSLYNFTFRVVTVGFLIRNVKLLSDVFIQLYKLNKIDQTLFISLSILFTAG